VDDEAKTVVGVDGQHVEVIPERLNTALDQVWSERGFTHPLRPIEIEMLVLDALCRIGHAEVVEDLRRQGRPPSGRMSRKATLASMSESRDACLRHAAGLLPASPKQRVAKRRAGSDRLSIADLARVMRFHMKRTGWTANKTAEFLEERLYGEYDARDLRNALVRDTKRNR
jgi:hypothetical protein